MRLAAKFAADGVQVKLLNVSHAFHSPLMDEMLDEFERFAAGIEFHAPQVPLAANLTGQLMTEGADGPLLARSFAEHGAVCRGHGAHRRGAADDDHRDRPDGQSARHGPAMRAELGCRLAAVAARRARTIGRCSPPASPSTMSAAGRSIGAAGTGRGRAGGCMLPNYPFQRSRHWFALDPSRRRVFAHDGDAASAAAISERHESFTRCWAHACRPCGRTRLFETRLSARSPAYLADHQVQGSPVTPAAAYVEQGLAAAEQAVRRRPARTGESRDSAGDVPAGGSRGGACRFPSRRSPAANRTFEVYSRPADASGRIDRVDDARDRLAGARIETGARRRRRLARRLDWTESILTTCAAAP